MVSLEALRARLKAERAIVIDVKVIPRASRSEISGFMDDGSLKVKVAAIPEKGQANREVCRVLAELFEVPERNVAVRSGETSQRKRIAVQSE